QVLADQNTMRAGEAEGAAPPAALPRGADMIRAAIAGLGWWGRTLVEAVQQSSTDIHFVAGTTRTITPDVQAFADAQQFQLAPDYEALLVNPQVDAVVLATPHSMHAPQVIAAAAAR